METLRNALRRKEDRKILKRGMSIIFLLHVPLYVALIALYQLAKQCN